MVEASSRDKILDFNNLKKNLLINGESFQLMARPILLVRSFLQLQMTILLALSS
jgi:hypothetical protein